MFVYMFCPQILLDKTLKAKKFYLKLYKNKKINKYNL